jgi:transposase
MPVHVPARACLSALLRREGQGAGAGSHAPGAAAEEGARTDDDARLQAPRHDHSVRRAQHLDGQVIGQCQQRPTHAEWLKFLRKIDRDTPKDKTLHLIADNYATHKHPAVQQWLAKHPRFNMHFTPTSASWLNMVERFFRDLTTDSLRRGVFTSVPELVAAIEEYVAHHNTDRKPFIWPRARATSCRR